jgi:hypothetical protein
MRAWALVFIVLLGCGDVQTVDARFSTPEHTVQTLLGAYGLRELTQDQVRTQLAERGTFELQDRASYQACFADFNRPGGEGLAGYVLGMIAAAKDDLRYESVGDIAYVFPREGIRIVMRREDGAYRIVLEDSVPEEVRTTLIGVERRANERDRLGTPLPR